MQVVIGPKARYGMSNTRENTIPKENIHEALGARDGTIGSTIREARWEADRQMLVWQEK